MGRKLYRETLNSFNKKTKNKKNLISTELRHLENLFVEK